MVLLAHRSRKANGDRRLDDHDSIWVVLDDQLDYCFNCRSIEEILLTVIVGRSSDDYKVGILVGSFRVQRSLQIQILFGKILFDVLVLNWGLLVVD